MHGINCDIATANEHDDYARLQWRFIFSFFFQTPQKQPLTGYTLDTCLNSFKNKMNLVKLLIILCIF